MPGDSRSGRPRREKTWAISEAGRARQDGEVLQIQVRGGHGVFLAKLPPSMRGL